MIAYITICIATIVSFINLLTKTSVEIEGKKNLKKPTPAGWILLMISISSLCIAIFSKISENERAQIKQKNDSLTRSNDSLKQDIILKSALEDLKLSRANELKSIVLESLAVIGESTAIENKNLALENAKQSKTLYMHSLKEAQLARQDNKEQKRLALSSINTRPRFQIKLSTDIKSNISDIERLNNWKKVRKDNENSNVLFFTDSTDRAVLFPGFASKNLPQNERIGFFEINTNDANNSMYSRISIWGNSTMTSETHIYGHGGYPAWRNYNYDFDRNTTDIEISGISSDTTNISGIELYDLIDTNPISIELHYELRGMASATELNNIRLFWQTHLKKMVFIFGFDNTYNTYLSQVMTVESILIEGGSIVIRWIKLGDPSYETKQKTSK